MSLFGISEEEVRQIIKEELPKYVLELDPKKRYLILMKDEEGVEDLAHELDTILDVRSSNLRVVITTGDVRILEF